MAFAGLGRGIASDQDCQAGQENCAGPREKRHLPDLGGAGSRRDYLDSDDLLLFARGVGHTLPKLLNSGVRASCIQENRNASALPVASLLHSSSGYLSSQCDDSFKVEPQRSSLGVAAVPSDQWPTGIMNSVIGSGAP